MTDVNSPFFDSFAPVRRRRTSSSGSVFPDPGYVPPSSQQPDEAEDVKGGPPPTPFDQQVASADQEGQQLLQQRAKQAAADQVAQQKQQEAQAKLDQANWEDQAKVDAANAKQQGIVTQEQTIPGPTGKNINVQAYTQNPDGTTAYKPADLGIQKLPDGSVYRVNRNQWGGQQYSDPYQAGVNANVALNAQGQTIATPKGKGATELPKKDVTNQGVAVDGTMKDANGNVVKDAEGNPLSDINVSPNAAIKQPAIESAIDAQERKLLTGNPNGTGKAGAAGQRVAETVGAGADDATQRSQDAAADYTLALEAHRDAVSMLHDASHNRDGTDEGEKIYQDAVAEEARARQKLADASQAKASTKIAADSKTAISKEAKDDPLGYLLNQSNAQPQQDQSISPQPGHQNNSEVTDTQKNPPPPADSNQPTSPAPTPDATPSVPDNIDPNSIAGLITGKYGQRNPTDAATQSSTSTAPDSTNNSSGSTTNPNQILGPNGQPIGELEEDGQTKLYRQLAQVNRPGDVRPLKPFVGPEAPARSLLDLSDNVSNSVTQGLGEAVAVPLARAQAMIHDLIMTGHGPRLANPNDGWGGRATQSDDDRMADLLASAVENPHIQSKDAGKLGNFLTKTAPAGVASTVGTISVAGGDPLVMAGLMGLSGGTAGYYDATAKGADPKTALAASAYGATVNTVMGLAMGGGSKVAARLAFGKNAEAFLQGAYKPTVKEAAKYLAADSGAQALLGAGTQLGSNAAAKTLYDPDRPLLDGVADAAGQQAVFAALHLPTLAGAMLNSTARGSVQRDTLNLAHAVDQLHSLQVTGGQTLEQINAYRAKMAADTASAISANDALNPEAKAAARKGIYSTWSPMTADEFKSLQTTDDGTLQASPEKIQSAADRVNQLQTKLQKTIGNVLANAPKPTPAEKAQAKALIPADVQHQQDALDQYNSTRPEGTAPATTDTLQKASDLAPLVNPGADTQPGSEHFVPIAHQIEQLTDPDAQATATAMIKATNGRGLTDAERALLIGDPANGVAPQVIDANTGQPFAKITADGQTILTDPGLARIKQLVPSATDILPRSEQSQIEAPQSAPSTASKKGSSPTPAVPDQTSAPAGSGGTSQPANIPPLDPRYAHLSDEALQTRIGSMTAAMHRAKAGGGNLPRSAQAELARLQGEIASRAQLTDDGGSSVGAEPGGKIGDEIPYSRINGDGQIVQARGEITDASHPRQYKIVDVEDGVERTVPIARTVATKPPQAKPIEKDLTEKEPVSEIAKVATPAPNFGKNEAESQPSVPQYPDDDARAKVRNLTALSRQSDSPVIRDRLTEAQAELQTGRAARGEKIDVGAEARKLGVTIIGDTDQIAPEHREVVMRAVNEFARYRKAFDAVGVDFIRLVEDFGGAGMQVASHGPGETEFQLAPDRLVKNWDGTPTPKTWLPKLMNEEYIHAATFDLLTKDFQTMGLGRDEWSMFLNHFGGKMAKELEQAHGGTFAAEVRHQYGDVDGVNLVMEYVRREVQKRLLGITTEDSFRNKPYTASFLRRLLVYIKAKLGLNKDVPQELRRMIAVLEAMTGEALKANDLPPLTPEERVGKAPDHPLPQVVDEDEDRRARAIGADLRPGQQFTLPSGRVVARDGAGNLVMREVSPDGLSERRIPGDRRLDAHRLTTPDIHEILSSSEQPELPTREPSDTAHADAAHPGDISSQDVAETRGVPSSGEERRPVVPEQPVVSASDGSTISSREPVPAAPLDSERPSGANQEQAPGNIAGSEFAERGGRTGGSIDAGREAGASESTQQRGRGGARTLPPLDTTSRINRDASARAVGGIKDDGLFPERGKAKSGALFVSKDGARATVTRVNKAKFLVAYRDSGQNKPWKTSAFTSLDSAVKNVTGRGFFYFGKADAALIDRLGAMSPEEVSAFVGSTHNADEDQLHVAVASLTDQDKTAQADAVQRELDLRQEDRARIQHEQEQADAIHEHLGPSLAEHIAQAGGLPKPGTELAGELGAIKPAAKIDQKRVGSAGKVPTKRTEYTQLYDAYRSLMSTPLGDLNRYQQNLKRKFAKNPLFTEEPKLSATEMAKSARANNFFKDGSALDDKSFVEALRDDIEGVPHYPDHGTATMEGQTARGASPVDTFDRQRGESAAQDYLDKNAELPFWLHQAVGKLFKSAMTRGSQAVDALIHRLQAGPKKEPYPVEVGRGRKETDERGNYIPVMHPGETRAQESLAHGMSAALAYREAQQARLQPVLAKALDIGSKVYQSVKSKAAWLAQMNDRLGDAIQGDSGALPNVFDFLAKHAGVVSPAEREIESNRFADQFVRDVRFGKGSDQFVPREDEFGEPTQAEQVAPNEDDRQEYEKELLQKLSQSEAVRTSPSEEARINRLILAGIQRGQNRFVFTDQRGKSAQIYAGVDGRATVHLPGDSMFAEPRTPFSDVRSAVEHLVDQGFEFQSSALEKKLAREGAINRFVAMIQGGLRLGQKRFHFDHEDGRTAALIARKDGKFSVAGIGETRKFQSVDGATKFLHDRGFGLMSSKLEKDLRSKGLHPDQANEPIPYTDKQRAIIEQYRRAKGLAVPGARPFAGLDSERDGFKEDRGVYLDPKVDSLPPSVRKNVDTFVDSIRAARYPNQRVRIDPKKDSTVLAYAQPAVHPDTISINTEHPNFKLPRSLSPDSWRMVASEEYWHNMHGLAARHMGVSFGQLIQDIFQEMTPEAVAETMHEYGGGALLMRSLGQYPDNFPPNLRFTVATEYARKLQQVLDDEGSSEQRFHPDLDVPMSDQTRSIVENTIESKARFPLLTGLLTTSRNIDNALRKADVTHSENVQRNQGDNAITKRRPDTGFASDDLGFGEARGGDLRPGRTDEARRGVGGPSVRPDLDLSPETQGPVVARGEPRTEREKTIYNLLGRLDAKTARGEELTPEEKLGYRNLTKALNHQPNLPTADYADTSLFARPQADALTDEQKRLVIETSPLAAAIARGFPIEGLEPKDVQQEANIGLLKAARSYDAAKPEDKGFPAYANTVIKNHLTDVARSRARRREDTTLDEPLGHDDAEGETRTSQVRDTAQDTGREVHRREINAKLNDAVSKLSGTARKVVDGLLAGKSGDEIAKDLNVTPGRVSAAKQDALSQLLKKLADAGVSKADIRELSVRGARPFARDFDHEPVGEMETPRQKHWADNALGFKSFAKNDVIPAARAVSDSFKAAGDSILKLLAPQMRSVEAARTARSIAAHLAWAAHERDTATEALRSARKYFQGMSVADCHDFIHSVETDRPFKNPELAEIYKVIRALNRKHVELARSMPSKHFATMIEHYMPHIWKDDPENLAKAEQFYKNKLEGSRAFIKHRTIPTVQEGLAHGLQLVSDNPVDLFLTRFSQMNRYVVGQRVLDELKQRGLALPFDRPEDAPLGWKRIDDRIGLSTEFRPDPAANPELPGMKGTGIEKRVNVSYYAPEQAVQILENHLSPGLRNHDNPLVRVPYKVIMGLANTLNQAQLGFSLFHLGFTTYDTALSQAALALRQAVPKAAGGLGQPIEAAKNLASIPVAPVTNFLAGSKLLKEWYAPGTQGGDFGNILQMAIHGGGRAKMDEVYSDQWGKAMAKAWR